MSRYIPSRPCYDAFAYSAFTLHFDAMPATKSSRSTKNRRLAARLARENDGRMFWTVARMHCIEMKRYLLRRLKLKIVTASESHILSEEKS